MQYQARDDEIIDYQTYYLDSVQSYLRGPQPPSLRPDSYISYIGAAQTFGAFVTFPFPSLLSERLGIPALNLGQGGATPKLFLEKPAFIELANQGKCTVVQVMTARGVSNSLLVSHDGRSKVHRTDEPSDTAPLPARQHYRRLLCELPEREVRDLVAQTRENWVQSTMELLERITVPKILLWFSVRAPEYEESYRSVSGLFGHMPQLVNRAMIDRVKQHANAYLEIITSEGLPQPLISRFTHKPTAIEGKQEPMNRYYPSPQMHRTCANLLEMTLRKLMPEFTQWA